jgi:hypothetical protein
MANPHIAYQLMEAAVIDATKEAVQQHGVESLVADDLTHTDLDKVLWSGGPLHPKYVEEALNRVPKGEVEYLAVRAPNGWPVAIGGIDYKAEEERELFGSWRLILNYEGLEWVPALSLRQKNESMTVGLSGQGSVSKMTTAEPELSMNALATKNMAKGKNHGIGLMRKATCTPIMPTWH